MRFPLRLQYDLFRYIAKQKRAGRQHYPLVLMLEPLHACNLACAGCGRIVEYEDTYYDKLTLQECLDSVDECGAPVVSVCGGEPLIYKPTPDLLRGCFERGKHVQLCTNAILLDKFMEKVPPHTNLTIQVHLDGMRETHDRLVCQEGVFDTVVPQMKRAVERGYRVSTNTTIYKDTSLEELEELFTMLDGMGVHGFLITPGYAYQVLDNDIYLAKQEVHEKFREIREIAKRHKVLSTPLYLDFLTGDRDLDCTPWANVTRNPRGWKGPCYLITDTHYKTYRELVESTDWAFFSQRRDKRCENCKLHSGFEASAAETVTRSPKEALRFANWVVR
ncbi:MAG TPA: adenosyl-hopene transferase HpnH [Deltaproteobacteria bacterium]|jgi:hopanoid biosynthesis associated radical SAM protein HpnH|nr:adenosyl-hopene transferase HpnH [Deltaproteobacteria bacterium]